MSRAFVKEPDGADVFDELPDRPISPHANLVTRRGLALLDAAVSQSRSALAEARARDDRGAKAAASRELRYFTARRASAELVPDTQDVDTVRFGHRVTIERDDGRRQTFRIVGEDEADPPEGLLSYVSPLARALTAKRIGDVVPAGQGEAEILAIEAVSEAPESPQ
jgi:transcription elongation GreA/GreB family factor